MIEGCVFRAILDSSIETLATNVHNAELTMVRLPNEYDWLTPEMLVNPAEVRPFVFHGWVLGAVFALAAITGFGRRPFRSRRRRSSASHRC